MIKNHLIQSNIVDPKGQKIAAALYLVTAHLPEHDPLRMKIRTSSLSLIDTPHDARTELSAKIAAMLAVGVMAKVISEHNARILEVELKYYADSLHHTDETLSALFPNPPVEYKGQMVSKKTFYKEMSLKSSMTNTAIYEKNSINGESKNKRQDTILSFINDRKSANIKDISTLFPDVSEKTIQRELGLLVSLGKINKRGDKRWSIYVSVTG